MSIISRDKGFTLIELLVVVAIIGLLAALIMTGVGGAKAKARDRMRTQALRSFHDGLELYFQDNNFYPFAGSGQNHWSYTYRLRNSDGTCDTSNLTGGKIRFENSVSPDFLLALVPKYIGYGYWSDPLGGTNLSSPYNCRYITPCEWPPPIIEDDDCPTDDNGSPVYFLHCGLEIPNEVSKNDGGKSDVLYEISEPYPWLCVTAVPPP